MYRKIVSIYIRQGKAYIPTLAKTELGVYMDIAPVYTVDLNIGDLTKVIEELLKTGNPKIPHPTRDQIKRLSQPVLKAAKVSSWKKLTEESKYFDISCGPESLTLEFFKLGEKRSFVPDTPKRREFPQGTNIEEIVQAIMDDVHSRPELQD